MFLLRENNTKASQNGILSLKVNASCAVIVKTYGIRPIRLNMRIMEKMAINILTFPKLLLFKMEAFISLSKYTRTFQKTEVSRLFRGLSFSNIGVVKIVIKII